MIRSFKRSAALLLAVPTLAVAQAPVVPLTDPVTPPPITKSTGPTVPMQMPGAPGTTPAIPAPADIPKEAPKDAPKEDSKDAPKEEETPPPTKYALEGLFSRTQIGKKLTDDGFRIYGWTEGVYTPSSASTLNYPLGQNDRANSFQLAQNWLHLEQTIDSEKKERQFGFVTDLILPGTDARFTTARGLLNTQFGNGQQYGIDLVRAYGQAFLPNVLGGTTVIAGKFYSPVGYESVDATQTPFASRSYSFLYNPYTVTGGFATINLTEDITWGNGFNVGMDQFFNSSNRLGFMSSLKWAPKKGNTSITLNIMVTDPKYDQTNAQNIYNVYNLVVTQKLTEKLRYALDATFSHEDNIPGVGSAHWYGFAHYLMYDVTDKLSWNQRLEFFEDQKGVRVGTPGLMTAVTTGLNWHPNSWFIFRPELRYDFNSGNGGAFQNGDHNLFTAAIGAIVRW